MREGNTVGSTIRRLMPSGSVAFSESEPAPEDQRWDVLPRSPMDVFAVAATLVERSGAYRYVVSPSSDPDTCYSDNFGLFDATDGLSGPSWQKIARAWGAGLHPRLKHNHTYDKIFRDLYPVDFPEETDGRNGYDKKYELLSGKEYWDHTQLTDAIPELEILQTLWKELVEGAADKKLIRDDNGSGCNADVPEEWWRAAIKLMSVADAACRGVGFWPRGRGDIELNSTLVQDWVYNKTVGNDIYDDKTLSTITSNLIDSSLCAVMPKNRTAALGCTLRSMTHNLALLPSPGIVQARWRMPAENPPRPLIDGGDKKNAKPLNILLVPFPYRFGARCFQPDATGDSERGWGFFNVKQLWLNRFARIEDCERSIGEIVEFVKTLMLQAKNDHDEIHAVVFPELSLDLKTFDAVSAALWGIESVEFIIAGLSEDPNPRQGEEPKGNFCVMRARPQPDGSGGDQHSRGKHHRWKLDKRQVERYGLSSALETGRNWWEGIALKKRSIDFFVPRAGTSMSTLICEDLARADPVLSVVRSIGPNLVLALLMDGPQRKSRWPGHYAGILADDPGCSVLTFTSLALISRSMTSDSDQGRSVAFFKNSFGQERELFLPQDQHALALRLTVIMKTENALDGRSNDNAGYIWNLNEVTPVRATVTQTNRWIVEGST